MQPLRKIIYRTIQKQGKGIRQHVSVSTFFDIEDVHSFRTHVKKLRAFDRWMGKDNNLLSAEFKAIYRTSGELRDIQVLLKAMEEKKEGNPPFIAWLQDDISRLRQLWDDSYHPATINNLQKKLRQAEFRRPSASRLRSFFNKGVDKTEAIVYLPAPGDEELHEIRKWIKDMYYVYSWGKKHGCADAADKTPELLNQVAEQCGRFNDKRMALSLLNAYLQQEQEEAAHQAAILLQQQWEEERLLQKRLLLETLRTFVEDN